MTAPCLIAIPLCAPDLALARALLTHLASHGPLPGHIVLFVADQGLTKPQVDPLLEASKPTFPSGGGCIACPLAITPAYPHAHNYRFETAAYHVAANVKSPWLWLDPRCVPTRRGWLAELETEYRAHAHLKPVLGALLTPATHGTAADLVSSTAIYPPTLPKRMLQRLIARRDVDWEKSCADILVPITHPTQLIFVQGLDGTDALPKPPSIASLVHTAQAVAYAASLRGEKPPERSTVPKKAPAPPEPALTKALDTLLKEVPTPAPASLADKLETGLANAIAKNTGQAPRTTAQLESRAAYYHSGNPGDVVYALAAIKLAGGGRLYLGPRVKRTPPPDNPIRKDLFDLLYPLLLAQPYISKPAYIDRYPGTDTALDLNTYRNLAADAALASKLKLHTIVAAHCHLLGVLERYHPDQTWLTAPSPIKTGLYVISRSPRHQDPEFPWSMICSTLRGKLLFVGLPSEHAAFQRQFKVHTAFWGADSFLDLARVIAGSLGFIGNQSLPCAIALGLGVPVCQEVFPEKPDCLFPRCNVLVPPFTPAQFKTWADGGVGLLAKETAVMGTSAVATSPPHPTDTSTPVPSVTQQTPWPCALLTFLDERPPSATSPGICHFNPSVHRIGDDLYLFTRKLTYTATPTKPWTSDRSSIAIWRLGVDRTPTLAAEPKLPLRASTENWEDPRVFQVLDRLYFSCCTWANGRTRFPIRQTVAALDQNMAVSRIGELPFARNAQPGTHQEKNWTWFVSGVTKSQTVLRLVYTIAPMVVYDVTAAWQPGTKHVSTTRWETGWPYGLPRGGTNPILHNGHYVTFFHSSLPWSGRQRRYYMGALAFSTEQPFDVLRFTPKPILTGSEADPRLQKGPLVVFPCGAVLEGDHWFVTFGVNDEKCGWIEIPCADLDHLMEAVP